MKGRLLHLGTRHPYRGYSNLKYRIQARPRSAAQVSPDSVSQKILDQDWSMIELLRNLSHVSRQFRHNLAEVFWTRIHLAVKQSGWLSLESFLKERPSTHHAIKQLTLDL